MFGDHFHIILYKALIIIFAFFSFLGCYDNSNFDILVNADSVLTQNPDSALSLLSKIKYPILLKDKAKADYWRIRSFAHSKRGDAMISDSLILFSLDYYRVNKEINNLLSSYFLTGEYYRWIGLPDSALSISTRGLIESENLNDTLLISKFLLFQASVEYDRGNFAEALQLHKRRIEVTNNHYSYYTAGLLQNKLNPKKDDYRLYLDKSIDLALSDGNSLAAAHYVRNYASILVARKNYREAIKLIEYSGAISDFYKDFGANHITMTNIFIQLNELDSAQVYLDKASREKMKDASGNYTNTNLLGYENAIFALQAVINAKKNKEIELTPMFQYNDWAIAENNRRNVILREQLSERYSLEKQNYELVIDRQKMQIVFAVSILFLFIIGISLYLMLMRKKRRVREIEEREEALQRLFRDALKVSDEKEKNSQLFRNTLLHQLGIIRLIATTPNSYNKDLLQKIVNISNEEVSTESLLKWNDLYPIIDSVYDNFYRKLCLKYGDVLNEKEIQLCCLLCADFSTAEISAVMQQSMQTIYQRKSSIRNKINTGEKEDIISFLREQI